jgi:hypothetical protein
MQSPAAKNIEQSMSSARVQMAGSTSGYRSERFLRVQLVRIAYLQKALATD